MSNDIIPNESKAKIKKPVGEAKPVSMVSVAEALSLNVYYSPKDIHEIFIKRKDVTRLGLELTGFLNYFDNKRILIMGLAEYGYLKSFSSEERYNILEKILSQKPPAIIIARNMKALDELLSLAEKYSVCILSSKETTSNLMASLVTFLNTELAPTISRHGVFVDIYGEGVLIVGNSGVGKSETAIELMKRGHRLIADDSVDIKKISSTTVIGKAPDNIRHFVELRGIGIINARRIFGVGAVKMSQNIDMVINLEKWDKSKTYNNIIAEEYFIDILGVEIPYITVPVNPGRNLAVIIEVAAMNQREKKMGFDAKSELLQNLGYEMVAPEKKVIIMQ